MLHDGKIIFSAALTTALPMAVELQDMLFRLPKLMPAAKRHSLEFEAMVCTMEHLRSAFMHFEEKARDYIDSMDEKEFEPL